MVAASYAAQRSALPRASASGSAVATPDGADAAEEPAPAAPEIQEAQVQEAQEAEVHEEKAAPRRRSRKAAAE